MDRKTKEVIAQSGDVLDKDTIKKIELAGVNRISVTTADFPVHLLGRALASPLVDMDTGEVFAARNQEIAVELLEQILDIIQ